MKIKVCKKTMDVVLLSNHSIIEYEYGVVDELHVVHVLLNLLFGLKYIQGIHQEVFFILQYIKAASRVFSVFLFHHI